MKLQRKGGNLSQIARQELTDEMLKRIEMKTRSINISDQQVDEAYAGFASRNKMSLAQQSVDEPVRRYAGSFQEIHHGPNGLGPPCQRPLPCNRDGQRTGSGAAHVEGWRQKPVATEYRLQQVIFVVPASKRSPALLAKRKQEANALRSRFQSCDTTRQQAKGILDVTVRDLGRIIEQQLPGEWSKAVKATPVGRTTAPQETEKGVEFLAVCSTRQVSDDRVAQLVFSMEGADSPGGQEKRLNSSAKNI